jgi:hypothetical protein
LRHMTKLNLADLLRLIADRANADRQHEIREARATVWRIKARRHKLTPILRFCPADMAGDLLHRIRRVFLTGGAKSHITAGSRA